MSLLALILPYSFVSLVVHALPLLLSVFFSLEDSLGFSYCLAQQALDVW